MPDPRSPCAPSSPLPRSPISKSAIARSLDSPGLPGLLLLLVFVTGADAAPSRLTAREIEGFVTELQDRTAVDRAAVTSILRGVRVQPSILEAISRPAEAKPWYEYRPLFLTEARIAAGIEFARKFDADLERAHRDYGVPVEIIVAIIGVETFYGRHKGKYRVIDALATLGFRYPKRSAFFRKELEHYLIFTSEQGLNPMSLAGSYAGAMGLPQFMPSSYRSYAVDFDGDAAINIWDNGTDAIGSVAAYLGKHGWKRDARVVTPALVRDESGAALANNELELKEPLSNYVRRGVEPAVATAGDPRVNLVRLQLETAPEYWFGHHNFYVITRYNRSVLYAMAVHQLAEAIRARLESR